VTTWFANQRKRHWFPKKRRALLDRGIAAGAGSGNAVAAATAAVESTTHTGNLQDQGHGNHYEHGFRHSAYPALMVSQERHFVNGTAHESAAVHQQARARIGFQHGAMPTNLSTSPKLHALQSTTQHSFSSLDSRQGPRGRYYSTAEMRGDAALVEDGRVAMLASTPLHMHSAQQTPSAYSFVSDECDLTERVGMSASHHQQRFHQSAPAGFSAISASQRTQSMPEEIGARAFAWRGGPGLGNGQDVRGIFASPFGSGMSAAGWLVHQRSRSVEASLQALPAGSAGSRRISSNDNYQAGAADDDGDLQMASPNSQLPFTDGFVPSSSLPTGEWTAPPSASGNSAGSSPAKYAGPTVSASSQISHISAPQHTQYGDSEAFERARCAWEHGNFVQSALRVQPPAGQTHGQHATSVKLAADANTQRVIL